MIRLISLTPLMEAADISGSIDRTAPLAERALLGLKTMALGLGTVFSVLILLWVILSLFRVFFYDLPRRKREKSLPPSEIPETPAELPTEISPAVPAEEETAIAAAITAAVALYLETEHPVRENGIRTSFRVVRYRKLHRA